MRKSIRAILKVDECCRNKTKGKERREANSGNKGKEKRVKR